MGILTKYDGYCMFCGKPTTEFHHCVFGVSNRRKCDEDDLIVPVCRNCHTTGWPVSSRIHDNPMAEKLSKIVGQLAWEKHAVAGGMTEDEAREAFRKRYGVSYL